MFEERYTPKVGKSPSSTFRVWRGFFCPCGCTSIKLVHKFEGIVNGEITQEKSGAEGFGYDPIFRPDGYDKTFAELGADIKNQISHRARATQKLAEYLKTL